MPIGLLIFVGICSIVLIALVHKNYVPYPFNWVVIGVVVVVWIYLLLEAAGFNMGIRVG